MKREITACDCCGREITEEMRDDAIVQGDHLGLYLFGSPKLPAAGDFWISVETQNKKPFDLCGLCRDDIAKDAMRRLVECKGEPE